MTPTPTPAPTIPSDMRDDPRLAALRERLARQAADRDLVDVAVRTADSPVGPLLMAATAAGLVRVAFASEGFEAVEQELADRISPRILQAPARLETVVRQLDDYFAGRRHRFEVTLDWQLAQGYRREVLTHLAADVDYGASISYGGLAALTRSPRAVRAVGTACATNPLPLVVPCHRVVRADGTPGRYRGGEVAKRTLLDLERHGRLEDVERG